MRILPILVDATDHKPRHRFCNTIRMTDAVMRKLRGTPRGTCYKAHIDRIHAVNELAATQTEDATKVREFMRTVVSASESTLKAVQDGAIATMHLKESVHEVNDSATSNTQSVDVIEQQVGLFKL